MNCALRLVRDPQLHGPDSRERPTTAEQNRNLFSGCSQTHAVSVWLFLTSGRVQAACSETSAADDGAVVTRSAPRHGRRGSTPRGVGWTPDLGCESRVGRRRGATEGPLPPSRHSGGRRGIGFPSGGRSRTPATRHPPPVATGTPTDRLPVGGRRRRRHPRPPAPLPCSSVKT